MRKIFILATLLLMILTSTAFAEENEPKSEQKDEPYVYTSEDFKFTITCPIKPIAVVENPWEEPEKRGEMLVFANEGFEVQYGYIIQVNAFEENEVPDFNKAKKAEIDDYLAKLKENNPFYSVAEIVNITKKNKGLFTVTAKEFEVTDKETGEVIGGGVADREYAFTFFRTPEGRCVSIQLLSVSLEEKPLMDTYRASVASFKDNSDPKQNKKAKKDKEKKEKQNKKDKDKK